ncbi:conserved hypothetical protein [Ricinus communis]|uniref:Uncharacterized protein n=1 Tax=Ricinus communis TaxID=3988 RepID=B9TDJ3_RICCO|nr:conserved hypothetical protein [Ricinus communis]
MARTVDVAAPSFDNHLAGLNALTLALGGRISEQLSLGLIYLDFARTDPVLYRLMFGEDRHSFSRRRRGTSYATARRLRSSPIELIGAHEVALQR